MLPGDCTSVGPVFVHELEGQHRLEGDPGAFGDPSDFLQQVGGPLLDRGQIICSGEELPDELVGVHAKLPGQVPLPEPDEFVNLDSECPAVNHASVEGRAFEDDELDLTPLGRARTRFSRCGDLLPQADSAGCIF